MVIGKAANHASDHGDLSRLAVDHPITCDLSRLAVDHGDGVPPSPRVN